MKASTIAAVLAPSAASANWWGGAPECAQSCLSSAWADATATITSANYWPAQSDYCDAGKGSSISSCINNGCSTTPTAISSYGSLSASLCSQYASCTSAGSTGVHTITYSAGPVNWGAPGGWNGGKGFGGGPGGNWGDNKNGSDDGWGAATDGSYWSEWASAYSGSKTWTGGVVTVTGCVGNGSPWFVGPGCGWNGYGGFNGWVGWGAGWSLGPTTTGTVTYTTTNAQGSGSIYTGVATVAAAVSGTITTTSILGAATATGNAAARVGQGAEGSVVTGMMGVALGAVVAVAGML
ncbi:uncharacterized protein BCR38DRAFT_407366 [Pseudomassariella vexata]|uniref:Uncharacterized protein n=1 Tax=Pseudomassariella vexata TaxID=1141098 RepID=A0A1Y2E7H6_9PEZI|nr:uncharacterized protein BCR38DRAFT_407366 [Pseudomassariella vexata]ORY67387.1 hypothetical protein BCR38DRAFT_407366 [Pseudomassariella vexata]